MQLALVALFGAAGACARYGLGVATNAQAAAFPWTTLAINVAGSFALGLVLGGGPGRLSPQLVTAAGTGFLGAFTTFSTFSHETQTMLRDHRASAAAAYVALSVVGGIAAAAAGWALGRRTLPA
ncbi:MAG: CrcB family protein [Acidimicrobiia bacterium]|nr:CrcB family protein [Acidimicrobiia bacterium]